MTEKMKIEDGNSLEDYVPNRNDELSPGLPEDVDGGDGGGGDGGDE